MTNLSNAENSYEHFPDLDSDGPFAKAINDFKPRPVQQHLASQIQACFKGRSSLLAEAGTGIGKTFAYLVPAIQSKSRSIISTATKNLQEQLFQRDIPKVCDVLNIHPRVALLKGRANYLCLYRMRQAEGQGRFNSKQSSHDYQTIVRWSAATNDGDLAELLSVSEDSEVRPQVTSTADNCLSMDCPDYDDCFVLKARMRAMKADILVINHHLLCADMALKDDGFGELLPEVDNVIIDEAHRLSDVVSMFFGQSFSSRQISELAGDLLQEYLTESKDLNVLSDISSELKTAISDCREVINMSQSRGSWEELTRQQRFIDKLETLKLTLQESHDVLKDVSDHTKGLESCFQRLERTLETLKAILTGAGNGMVQWFEIFKHSFVIHQTPIAINKIFRQQWQSQGGSWIFTSATLAIANQLEHYKSTMGLDEAKQVSLPSPFDYHNQAVMYLPDDLPAPTDPNHTKTLMKTVLPVLRATKGRSFCLFTSYRAVHEAAEWLSVNSQFTLLIQGTADKTALLERFIKEKNTILLATSSFWEGVDVRGADLSCVVIDRLPFSVPSDPVLKARIEMAKKEGRNAFAEIQLPTAVLALKQGAGRLIRDQGDRGILILGDNRLITKGYGKQFIDSLPDMYRTRSEQKVINFIKEKMSV